jgi:hypothetical protein
MVSDGIHRGESGSAAYDAKDGSLSGASLVWTSDSDGQQAAAGVSVNVFYKLHLSLVRRQATQV